MTESQLYTCWHCLLCYSNHDELSSLASYLAIYDQVDHRLSKDVATGGLHKGDQFASAMFPIFTQNRLLFSLRKTFSVHYGETYPDDEIQEAKDLMAQAEANPAMNPTIYYWLAPYIYVSRMEALKKPNWLVEVFNRHLESDDWPSYDKAAMNPLTWSQNSMPKQELEDWIFPVAFINIIAISMECIACFLKIYRLHCRSPYPPSIKYYISFPWKFYRTPKFWGWQTCWPNNTWSQIVEQLYIFAWPRPSWTTHITL